MVTKDKIFGEEGLKPSDVEKYLNLVPLSNLDQTDFDDITFTNTTYDTKKSWVIDAGAISNYVLIKCQIYGEGFWGTGGSAGTNTTQFTVDSVQVFETSVSGNYQDSQWESQDRKICVFKYVPTTLQKANGFTIDIDSKKTGVANSIVKTGAFELWGC